MKFNFKRLKVTFAVFAFVSLATHLAFAEEATVKSTAIPTPGKATVAEPLAQESALSEEPAMAQLSSDAPENALARLKEVLTPITSLQGGFQQKVSTEKGKTLHQSAGKMWLKKPGQFRWEVDGKAKNLIVSDGKQVWNYDAELSQVTIQKLPKTKGTTPIYFLTGDVDSIGNDFTVTSLGVGKCMKDSDACFELKPKGGSSTFHWIKVGFRDKTLKEMELLDQLGQHSLFSFHSLVVNKNIPQKQFHFTPPKGVDVVRH